MPELSEFVDRVRKRREARINKVNIRRGIAQDGKTCRVDPTIHARVKSRAREVGAEMYEMTNAAIMLGLERAAAMMLMPGEDETRGNR